MLLRKIIVNEMQFWQAFHVNEDKKNSGAAASFLCKRCHSLQATDM